MQTITKTQDTGTAINEPALPQIETFGDGYDYMDAVQKFGWEPIASWGDDGWDFGAWPLVIGFWRVIYHDRRPRFGFGLYIEGDLRTEWYDTPEGFTEAVSREAHFFWRNGDAQGPQDLPERFEDVPAKYRRPF